MFLNLLLLCGILSQGFIGTFADKNISDSLDILVRQKRVINREPGHDVRVVISNYPYIVMIRFNTRISCAGSILSNHVVITASECTQLEIPIYYNIVSKSARSDHGTLHNVTDIRKHVVNRRNRFRDGIALLTVHPPFVFDSYTFKIELHSGPLLPGTLATISGWGYNCGNKDRGTKFPKNLRAIEVPIMAHRDCVNIYRPYNIEISETDICTHDPQKHCGHNDGGAPLVVDNYLAGVHLWAGPARSQIDPQYPDVFAMLQHAEYNQWIRTNIHNIEAQFQNRLF